MYADNTVLFSESVKELQTMINVVNDFSNEHNLYINLSKTKIVVFRNRGNLRPDEKWFLNGNSIENCNEFLYLGLLFQHNGNFVKTQKKLSEQGRKAIFCLFSKIHNDYYNHETLLSLYDTYVGSILNYGCELWGHHTAPDIEKVHLYFLKRILKVRKSTINNMVYCELGRLPMYVERQYRMVKYWIKLLHSENCILKACYNEMFENSYVRPNDKLNWCCKIRDILCRYGFNYIWLSQNVCNVELFLLQFKQRIVDIFISEVNGFFETSSKCIFYKHIYSNHALQYYLDRPVNYIYKPYITRYRICAHNLNIETGRFYKIDRCARLCTNCDHRAIEDEYHFILECPKYVDIRNKYIKTYYWKRPSSFKLVQLLSVRNLKELNNLGKYLKLAERLRSF